MNWKTNDDDTSFLKAIESCTYPIDDFDHCAHLRLAYIYLSDSEPSSALALMRTAIQQLLRFNHVDGTKYHATLTKAWIFAVHHFMTRVPECQNTASFLESAQTLHNTKIMETHFSPALLFSDLARRSAVDPDRDPIPNYST